MAHQFERRAEQKLAGKVAFITGASSGNGRAIALRLAEDGARIVNADLAEHTQSPAFDGDRSTVDVITEGGGEALHVRCDVTDGASVTAAYERAVDRFGRLDIVVANAGISPQPPVHLPEEEFDVFRKVTQVNQEGAWWTAREGARILREQGEGGKIVFTSSIAGLVGSDSGAHYCMSKGAINQLTRALAFQLAPSGINVNAVCPGFIRTAMTEHYLSDPEREALVNAQHPLGRVGEASDVADAIAFLAGPESNWITGVLLPVDGGYTAV
ncbi:SDR family oxidoreductase [Leucobacter allii]|uniref:SDR family NAD(P)-dependent oxidoreductase n=1 Tax=Leucobacter allii TaxID=2932247 RepID=UPI001FD30648|nr:SDR family oxidoreductase [Leucobacter allii]UOR01329.1 SDR family oxidoreductase [Leucobacter allii]